MYIICDLIFLAELLKFFDKMDLSIRLRVIYNVKHRYVICLEFGDKFLTFLTKLVLEAKVLQVTIIIGGFFNKPQSNSYSISVSENVYHW